MNRPTQSSVRPASVCMWGAVLFFGLTVGQAAGAAGAPADSAARPAPAPARTAGAAHHGSADGAHGRVYRTVAGDTADRVVKKAMADVPLKDELLRYALIQANVKAFPNGKATRLKAGTELALPDTHALLRQILLPLLSPSETGAFFPPPPSTAEERRRWVRFP